MDEPRVVDPGPPPADAIVLLDGEDLSQWKSDKDGGPAKWEIKDGAAIVNGTGGISTKQDFDDCQLHIEPLALQDHHNPVRFRNIWIREL